MRTGLIAEKVGMTQFFAADGTLVPVTVLQVSDNVVVGKKTADSKDGYDAIQVGAKKAKINNVTKPMREFFSKKEIEPRVHLKEFRVSAENLLDQGSEIKADHLSNQYWARPI